MGRSATCHRFTSRAKRPIGLWMLSHSTSYLLTKALRNVCDISEAIKARVERQNAVNVVSFRGS